MNPMGPKQVCASISTPFVMVGTLRATDIPDGKAIRVVRRRDLERFTVERRVGYVGSGLRYYVVHNPTLFSVPKVANDIAHVRKIINEA